MDQMKGYGTVERVIMFGAAEKMVPMSGSMELLPLCNMNCDMCYVRLTRAQMESQGRLRSGAEWLKLGREMADAGTLFLLLTGGEPLMHPDFQEIFLGLKKMGMILTVNTNGTLIDEAWAGFFTKNKPRRINITLYGGSNETYEKLCHFPGGFDRVINAVKLLRQGGVDVHLGCSATPANAANIPGLYDIAAELGVPMETDCYMLPAVRERSVPFCEQNRLLPEAAAAVRIMTRRLEMGEERFRQYRQQMLAKIDGFIPGEEMPCKGTCLAGKCSFSVNWQGQLRPCVITTEPAANVFDRGFAECWQQISKEFGTISFCAKCSNCALRPLCSPCAVASKIETGDYMGKPEYLCRYAAETARLLRQMGEDSHE